MHARWLALGLGIGLMWVGGCAQPTSVDDDGAADTDEASTMDPEPTGGSTSPGGSGGSGSTTSTPDSGSSGGAGGGTDDATTSGGPEVPEVPEVVSFSQHVVPIFEATCGSSTAGCHDAEPYNANFDAECRGWLSLANQPLGSVFNAGENTGQPTGCEDFTLHTRLLDIGAWTCSPVPGDPGLGGGVIKKFIVPGNPSESYLLQRVTWQDGPCEQMEDLDPMPLVGDASDYEIEVLTRWIEQGALDN